MPMPIAGVPDGYRPRRGDVVLIRATVAYQVEPSETYIHFKIVGAEHVSGVIPFDHVCGLVSRRWKAGDEATARALGGEIVTVLATHEHKVWCARPDGQTITCEDVVLEVAPSGKVDDPREPPPDEPSQPAAPERRVPRSVD